MLSMPSLDKELCSDTWEEFYEKIKKRKWDKIPIIDAMRMSDGKIHIIGVTEISIEVA